MHIVVLVQAIPFRDSAFAALAILILAGCQRAPEPAAEDIIAYARNGAVGAKVRHLGPAVQPYVERVFRAYNAWHETFAPVADLADANGLWSVDSPKWRDAEAVDRQFEKIQQWRDTAGRRAKLHQDLVTAVAAVPAAYQQDTDRIRAQIMRIFDTAQPKQLGEIVRRDESLLALIREARATFDLDKSGLAFCQRQTTAKARELWNGLHTVLDATRKDELQQIDWALTTGKELRDEAIKKKQTIDHNSADARAALRAIRALDIDIHYYDKMIDDARQRKKQLEKSP